MKFKFKAKYLPMLARFAAKQDIRYYMNGFCIEAAEIGGVYLVATNGHAMLVIHDADGCIDDRDPSVAAIRVTPGLVSAAKSCRRSYCEQNVVLNGKRLSIAPGFGLEHAEVEVFVQGGNPLICGKYPDWRKVIPDFSRLKPGALEDGKDIDLRYLAKFDLADVREGNTVSLWRSEGDGMAVIVQCIGVPEAVGIVMPVRGENKILQLAKLRSIMPKKKA